MSLHRERLGGALFAAMPRRSTPRRNARPANSTRRQARSHSRQPWTARREPHGDRSKYT